MTRMWLAVVAGLALAAPAAAQVEFTYSNAIVVAQARANRFTDLSPDFCEDPQPPDRNMPPLSIMADCSAQRSGEAGGSATATADGSVVVTPTIVGTAANGKPLVSAVTIAVTANGGANTTTVGVGNENTMQAAGGVTAGASLFLKGAEGTPVTVSLQVSAMGMPFGQSGCSSNLTSGQMTLDGAMNANLGCIADVYAEVNASHSQSYTATLTVTFGPPPDDDEIVWVEPQGGEYADEDNWEPPQVPEASATRADTAIFDLATTYPVNVSGAKAKRFVIRNGSIDLVGGTAEATSSAPAEPSLVIGANGKLHVVSGTLTTVDSVLGDVSGGRAEVNLISGTPTWNNTGRLTIGDAGPGRLTVVSGTVTSAESRIGGGPLGVGEAIVGGPGSWTTGNLGLGLGGGTGALEIRDGGRVDSDDAVIGVVASEVTAVFVRDTTAGGEPSNWNVAGLLQVGTGGIGILALANGATVDAASLEVGEFGQVVIDRETAMDEPSSVDVAGAVTIAGGTDAMGLPRGIFIGRESTLTAGSVTVHKGVFLGGNVVTGPLVIRDPGVAIFGEFAGESSAVLLALEPVTVDGLLRFGASATVDLQGGLLIGSGTQGPGVSGRVELEEFGDRTITATIANGIAVANGQIVIKGGPEVTIAGSVDVGTGAAATGAEGLLFVQDPDGEGPSTLTLTQGALAVGVLGPGQLAVSEGSSVTTPMLKVGGAAAGRGDVFVEDATLACTGDARLGDLDVGYVTVTGGTRGTGLVVGGSVTIGTTAAAGGILLRENGAVAAAGGVTVNPASFITGNGTVAANVTVRPGGLVEAGVSITAPAAPAPNAERAMRGQPAGVLTIAGNLVVDPGGTVRVAIGGADAAGVPLVVHGDAALGGALEIAFVNGFVPRAGDRIRVLDVLGLTSGAFTSRTVTGLPPGWKGELTGAGADLALTVFGDYLCYQTAAAKGFKFPKGLATDVDTALGPIAVGVKKPLLLCNPSGPSTGSGQGADAQLRGYLVEDATADPLAIDARTLRVTNGLHPGGELLVDTSGTTLVLAAARRCDDTPPGACPADLAPPSEASAFVCARAKRSKAGPAFPKGLVASAIDEFGEPRTYALSKPTRVCAPTSGDLTDALACYVAKPLGKACATAAPANAAGACRSELDCGGTKKVTAFCAKQVKHAKRGTFVLATALATDRAGTVKPVELCVPSTLAVP